MTWTKPIILEHIEKYYSTTDKQLKHMLMKDILKTIFCNMTDDFKLKIEIAKIIDEK